ncbi:MAG TPA: mycothiol synthase [Acidimicrobiia bacterium]
MLDVRVRRPVAPADVATIHRLAALAEEADGHPSLGDSVWRDLAQPSARSAVVVATMHGEPVGALHVAPPENDGDAVLTMATVVVPEHRDDDVERGLLEVALADPVLDGQRVRLWVFGADERADQLARALGFALERELRQMRVPLPLAEEPRWPNDVDVRAFRVGADERTWLDVNNRAFAEDPDQHGWTLETLRRREAEPWFDPAGFLLAWRGGALAGFCWTRLHAPSPPHEPATLGEIYVIGVDPAHQGIGLGRALVVGGLHALFERAATAGMLFVDAANTAAVALYEGLGFTTTRVDRAYLRAAS